MSYEGRGGGIALLWKNQLKLSIIHFSKSPIYAEVKIEKEINETWFLTGIYGQPKAAKRHETLSLIRPISVPPDQSWLLMGDFNEIPHIGEKRGGRVRLEKQMADFRVVMQDCELTDIGFRGPQFTWWNGRENNNNISERLDRFIANMKWRSSFPMIVVEHIPVGCGLLRPLPSVWRSNLIIT